MSMQGGESRSHQSTLEGLDPEGRSVVDRVVHYIFLIFVVVVLVLGLFNLLGPRVATTSVTGDSLELRVRYDRTIRPGLAATWSVEVVALDGAELPDQLELTTTSSYFELFDENALSPEPVDETADAELTRWTFEPEPGSTALVIELDARVQPGWQGPEEATTTLVVDGAEPISVAYRTWPLP